VDLVTHGRRDTAKLQRNAPEMKYSKGGRVITLIIMGMFLANTEQWNSVTLLIKELR
jgi:hypothetical protein